MRFRTRTWSVISLLLMVGAAVCWWLGDKQIARDKAAREAVQPSAPASVIPELQRPQRDFPAPAAPTNAPSSAAAKPELYPHRLRNTAESLNSLVRNDRAILLENAWIDTKSSRALDIPQNLRASQRHGSYIVQADGPPDDGFRAVLQQAGASIVSYVPNNAYLVRLADASAETLRTSPKVAALVAYEPYFKLESALLDKVLDASAADAVAQLNVTGRPRLMTPSSPSALSRCGGTVRPSARWSRCVARCPA
jgi:hypothetical protein